MTSKFSDFRIALRLLCLRHHVSLRATEGGHIAVLDGGEGDVPVVGLLDRTGDDRDHAHSEVVPIRDLPDYFLTVMAAMGFPGYLTHDVDRPAALAIASRYPGAKLVPIGRPRQVRSWAVIAP